MKFITIKNSKNKLAYTVRVEGETVVIYVFDQVKQGFIRAIQVNRKFLLKKLINL